MYIGCTLQLFKMLLEGGAGDAQFVGNGALGASLREEFLYAVLVNGTCHTCSSVVVDVLIVGQCEYTCCVQKYTKKMTAGRMGYLTKGGHLIDFLA